MAELKIQMTLDLKPFSKGLVSALNMGKSFRTQFTEIASGMRVDVDESAFKNEIKKLDGIYDQFRKEAQQEVKLDADGKKIKAEADKAKAKIKEVPQKKTTIFTGNATSLLDQLSRIGLAYNGVMVIMSQFGNLINPFKTFEKEMANANTLLRVSQEELDGYKDQIRDIAKETGKAPVDLAKSFYQAVSAGYAASDALNIVDISARAAVAGVTQTETAVDGITTVLNAFKIEAGETNWVADIMFKTVERGKTTFPELSQNFAQVAVIAASSKVKFDQISGAIATLTKQGTPTAQAVTQIRAAILAANEVLGDGWSKTMSLQEAFQELSNRAGGSQNKLRELVGRVEALNGVLGLTGQNSKMAAEDLDAMKNSANAMTIAFSIQSGTLEERGNRVSAMWTVFREEMVGKLAPALAGIFSGLAKVINFLDNNQTVLQTTGVALLAIAGYLGIAKLATISWNSALMANPVVAIAAGVIALSIAIGVGVQKLGGWRQAWEYAKASIQITWEYIKAFGQGLVDYGVLAFDVLTSPFKILWDTVKEVFTNIGTAWKLLLSGDFAGAFEIARRGITTGFQGAMDDIKASAGTLLNTFDGLGAKSKEIWTAAKIDVKEVTGAIEGVSTATEEAIGLTAEQGAAIKKAKEAWESWAKAYDESKLTDSQKIKIEFEAQEANLAATFEKGTPAFKAAYQKLLDWREGKLSETSDNEAALEMAKIDKMLGLNDLYLSTKLITENEHKSNRLTILQSAHERAVELYGEESEAALTTRAAVLEFERLATEEELLLHEQKVQMYLDATNAVVGIMQGFANFEASQRKERLAKQRQELAEHTKNKKAEAKADLGAGKITEEAYQKRIANIEQFDKSQTEVFKKESQKRSGIEKATSIAQTTIATYEMATKAYKAMVGIPVVGPVLAAIAAGAALALGLKNLSVIQSTPAYALGGKIRGGKQTIQVNEEGEEYIVNAPATRILGPALLTKIMAFPQKTKEILSQVAFPGVDVPQPAFAFDTGGSTANVSSNINSSLIVDLEPIYQRLDSIENAINQVSEINEKILDKELRADIDAEEMAVIVETGNKILAEKDM